MSAGGLEELPEGWASAKPAGGCAEGIDGTHHSPKEQSPRGEFKYVTAKNIKEFGIDLKDITYIPKSVHQTIYSRCNPEKGDILYIKDGATTGLATVNQLDDPFSLLSSV